MTAVKAAGVGRTSHAGHKLELEQVLSFPGAGKSMRCNPNEEFYFRKRSGPEFS